MRFLKVVIIWIEVVKRGSYILYKNTHFIKVNYNRPFFVSGSNCTVVFNQVLKYIKEENDKEENES